MAKTIRHNVKSVNDAGNNTDRQAKRIARKKLEKRLNIESNWRNRDYHENRSDWY